MCKSACAALELRRLRMLDIGAELVRAHADQADWPTVKPILHTLEVPNEHSGKSSLVWLQIVPMYYRVP